MSTGLVLNAGNDIDRLQARLALLEARVAQLEAQLYPARDHAPYLTPAFAPSPITPAWPPWSDPKLY